MPLKEPLEKKPSFGPLAAVIMIDEKGKVDMQVEGMDPERLARILSALQLDIIFRAMQSLQAQTTLLAKMIEDIRKGPRVYGASDMPKINPGGVS